MLIQELTGKMFAYIKMFQSFWTGTNIPTTVLQLCTYTTAWLRFMIIIVLFIENFIWTFLPGYPIYKNYFPGQACRTFLYKVHYLQESKRVLWINTVPYIEAGILLLNSQNQQNSRNSFKRIWYCLFKNIYVMKPQRFLVFGNYF